MGSDATISISVEMLNVIILFLFLHVILRLILPAQQFVVRFSLMNEKFWSAVWMFHRPVSVSGRAAPAPSPCWTAAAPGLYFGTDIDRSPAAVFKKKFNGNTKTLTKYKKFRKIIVQFLPAEVFCLFHFLSAAPFLHTGAGSHRHVLLFS